MAELTAYFHVIIRIFIFTPLTKVSKKSCVERKFLLFQINDILTRGHKLTKRSEQDKLTLNGLHGDHRPAKV